MFEELIIYLSNSGFKQKAFHHPNPGFSSLTPCNLKKIDFEV